MFTMNITISDCWFTLLLIWQKELICHNLGLYTLAYSNRMKSKVGNKISMIIFLILLWREIISQDWDSNPDTAWLCNPKIKGRQVYINSLNWISFLAPFMFLGTQSEIFDLLEWNDLFDPLSNLSDLLDDSLSWLNSIDSLLSFNPFNLQLELSELLSEVWINNKDTPCAMCISTKTQS